MAPESSPTIAIEMLPGLARALPGLSFETCADYSRRNQQIARPPAGLQLGGRPTVLDAFNFDPQRGPRDFFRRYPRTPGHFSFSRPGLDSAGNQALLAATRMDCLYHPSRPERDPLESAYFSVLCLLERDEEAWRLAHWTDWMSLWDSDSAQSNWKERAEEWLQSALAEAGWEVRESEEERLRLRGPTGNFVTVVTDGYLSRLLVGRLNEPPPQKFFICQDPLLIVHQLHPQVILEGLQ